MNRERVLYSEPRLQQSWRRWRVARSRTRSVKLSLPSGSIRPARPSPTTSPCSPCGEAETSTLSLIDRRESRKPRGLCSGTPARQIVSGGLRACSGFVTLQCREREVSAPQELPGSCDCGPPSRRLLTWPRRAPGRQSGQMIERAETYRFARNRDPGLTAPGCSREAIMSSRCVQSRRHHYHQGRRRRHCVLHRDRIGRGLDRSGRKGQDRGRAECGRSLWRNVPDRAGAAISDRQGGDRRGMPRHIL